MADAGPDTLKLMKKERAEMVHADALVFATDKFKSEIR